MELRIRKIIVAATLAALLAGALAISFNASEAFADDSLQTADATSPTTPPAPHADGWELVGSTWNYWKDNAQVSGQLVTTATGPAIPGIPAGSHTYWIDTTGALALDRVVDSSTTTDAGSFASGKCAYADKFGQLATGKTIVGKKVYLAKSDFTLETGDKHGILVTKAYDSGKRAYFIDPAQHCAVVTTKPVKVKGFGWVFARGKQGWLMTGRTVIGNKIYLARSNGRLETGNKRGFLLTKRYGGKSARLYYISPKTHAITYGRAVKVSKKFGYVFAPNKKGNLLRSMKRVDKKHVILAEKNGRIANHKGWLVTSKYTGSEQKYRIERTKKYKKVRGARIGLFTVKGTKYFAHDNGTILTNTWMQLGNTVWRVAYSGAFYVDNTVTRLYHKAQDYWSPSRYLIMVDVDNPRTMVFEGSRGNWGIKFIWDCCTGSPSTPTISGTFSIGAKGYSFGEGSGYSCYYWSQISGDYLFHSQLYFPYTWRIQAPAMGSRVSHGCVRLYADNARWIWDNVPSGTTVACIY